MFPSNKKKLSRKFSERSPFTEDCEYILIEYKMSIFMKKYQWKYKRKLNTYRLN